MKLHKEAPYAPCFLNNKKGSKMFPNQTRLTDHIKFSFLFSNDLIAQEILDTEDPEKLAWAVIKAIFDNHL